MKVLDQNHIRSICKCSNKVPIYNTNEETLKMVLKEYKIPEGGIELGELRDLRPFDEMAISVSLYAENNDCDYYFVAYFNKDGSVETSCFFDDGQEVYWNSKEEKSKFLKSMYGYALRLFGYKRTKIYLNEGKVTRIGSGKKNKIKKSKYIYIGFDKVINNAPKNFRTNQTYAPHQVCGHWREIPGKNGHDRNGNPVNDKTWIKPYEKGEGKEIMERIRIWK